MAEMGGAQPTVSKITALAVGVAVQGFSVRDALVAAVEGFDLSLPSTRGLEPASFGADFGVLVVRGGLQSMVGTLLIVLAAFLLAAGMGSRAPWRSSFSAC